MCLWISEQRQYAVTHVTGNRATKTPNRRGAAELECDDYIPKFFGIQTPGKLGGTDKITKQDGKLTAYGLRTGESAAIM
jgi:hypothetical protein